MVGTMSGVIGTGGSVMYVEVSSEVAVVDVNDVENVEGGREGGEEDIAGSGVGEENVKVGNNCGFGVSVNSSSRNFSRNSPFGNLSDTLARIEANVSENARFALPSRGVVDSSLPAANVGTDEVARTPAFPLQVRCRVLVPIALHPVGSSIGS